MNAWPVLMAKDVVGMDGGDQNGAGPGAGPGAGSMPAACLLAGRRTAFMAMGMSPSRPLSRMRRGEELDFPLGSIPLGE